jgi:hypothetical protein
MSVPAVSVAGAMQLPAFAYQCSWHEYRPFLSLEFVLFHPLARWVSGNG